MPSEFITALCSSARNERIPEDCDFFGGLIGGRDIVWNDHLEEAEPRRVKGEWIFSRVLDGTAVQDLFIVSSRENAYTINNPLPNTELRSASSIPRL